MDYWSSRYREYENQCVEASKLPEGAEREAAYCSAEALREELLRDPDAPKSKVFTEREKLLTRIVACWLIHGNELSEYQRNAWSRWIDNPTDKTPLAKHPKFLELAEEWQDCVGSESPTRTPNLSKFILTENQALEVADLLGGLRGELDLTIRSGDLYSVAIDAGVAFNALVELRVPIEMEVGQFEINRIVQAKPAGARILLAELLTAMNTACEVLGEIQVANDAEAETLSTLLERLPDLVVSQQYRNELVWEFGAIDGRSQRDRRTGDDEKPADGRDQATYELRDEGLVLVCGDRVYNQTTSQAAIVKVLFEAFEAGRPSVSQDSIREAVYQSIDGGPAEIREVFRGSSSDGKKGEERYAFVWREVIERGERRNTLRLKDPEKLWKSPRDTPRVTPR